MTAEDSWDSAINSSPQDMRRAGKSQYFLLPSPTLLAGGEGRRFVTGSPGAVRPSPRPSPKREREIGRNFVQHPLSTVENLIFAESQHSQPLSIQIRLTLLIVMPGFVQ